MSGFHVNGAREYSEGSCWKLVRAGRDKNPWKQFFVSQAEFDEHNQSGMAREDPQGHRWCSAKLLFDYTPYATREDWLCKLTYQRWMWVNLECWRQLLEDRSKGSSEYAKDSEIWKHFQLQELAGVFRYNAEHLLAEEPYAVFGQRNDWARNGIAAKLRQMPRARREKHYAKVHSMAQCWPVPPAELLWVGGTYARSPDLFPAYQQEHAIWSRSRCSAAIAEPPRPDASSSCAPESARQRLRA